MAKAWLRWISDRLRSPDSDLQDLGSYGEAIAEKELRKRGYQIIERNYRCRLGEIDIVAKQDDETVIVEVKTRSSGTYGDPQDAVTPQKARRLVALGMNYLAEKGDSDAQWRIDVVAIRLDEPGRPTIEVITNAVEN